MLRHFQNRYTWMTVAFTLFHQSLYAYSLVGVAKVIAACTQPEALPHALLSLFALMGVFYALEPPFAKILEKARWAPFSLVLKEWIATHTGRISPWTNPKARELATTAWAGEVQNTLTLAVNYGYDLFGTLVAVCLGVSALITLLSPMFLWAYLASFLLSALLIRWTQSHTKSLSQKQQNEKNALNAHLQRSWDNVLLGNPHSFALWAERLERLLAQVQLGQERLASHTGWISAMGIALAAVPVFAAVAYTTLTAEGDTRLIALAAATLPRQIQMLNQTRAIIRHATQWSRVRGQLKSLERLLQLPEAPASHALSQRIACDKIHLLGPTPMALSTEGVDQCVAFFTRRPLGRFTMSGDNGSGKSTLALLIKEKMGTEAYYLPFHSTLEFLEDGTQSTGQSAKNKLVELLKALPPEHMLILDEWDANLDLANTAQLDDLLENESKNRTILEIRHKKKSERAAQPQILKTPL